MTRQLETLEFVLPFGLQTKFRGETKSGQGLIRAENVDTFEIFQGLGKIPGSTRESDQFPDTVTDLQFFEYFALDGTLTKEPVAVSDGSLYRINSDKTITEIGGSFPATPLTAATLENRLYLTGATCNPQKYDGTAVSTWGVVAPGSTETVVLETDSAVGWTMNGLNTIGTSASTEFLDSSGSLQLNKLDTGTIILQATLLGISPAIDLSVNETFFFYFFIPGGALPLLQTSGRCLSVEIGDGSFTDYNQYDFTVGQFAEGWNLIGRVLDEPTAQFGTGLDPSNLEDIRIVIEFSNSGTEQSGFLVDSFFTTDRGFLDAASGGAGNVLDDVRYRVTFENSVGQESNAGPASDTFSAGAGTAVNLSNIPISEDPTVVIRHIYRDKDGDGIYLLVTTINDNTTTAFQDNLAPTSLGVATPPILGSLTDDNAPPERLSATEVFNSSVFGINAENPDILEVSDPNEPGSFPLVNRFVFTDKLTALKRQGSDLIITSENRSYFLAGATIDDYIVTEYSSDVGSPGFRALESVRGLTLGWHDDGLYLHQRGFDSNTPVWYLGSNIKDLTDALDETAFKDMFMLHNRSRFQIVLFLKSVAGGGVYDTIFSLNYGTIRSGLVSPEGQGIDALNIKEAVYLQKMFPDSYNPTCGAIVQTGDKPELWIGSGDFVYQIDDTASLNWAIGGSDDEAVVADFETTAAWAQGDQDGYGAPRYLILNAEGTVRSTWTVTISGLDNVDGKVLQTKAFSVSFGPDEESPKVPVPGSMQPANAFRIRMQNSNLDEDGVIKRLALQVIPRGSRGRRVAGGAE